jgi:hypothetical protein
MSDIAVDDFHLAVDLVAVLNGGGETKTQDQHQRAS